MFLSCDIGNSNIKAGLFSGKELVESYSFQDINQFTGIYSEKEITKTGISSVVPELTDQVVKFLDDKSFDCYCITPDSAFNVKIKYKTPQTLGTDRICSAEGAFLLNRKIKSDEILLSIDFGTATTINVVYYPGEFMGGLIAPGVKIMGEALHNSTAQLPVAGFDDFEEMIGGSTITAVASGLINATLGMTERFLAFIQNTFPTKKIKIFITGGNAEKIISRLDFKFIYEKNLVLYGIKAVTDLNSRN